MKNPFRYFNNSPDIIRLTAMMYIRCPLSLRQVVDLMFERGIDICHETVRFWWNRFGLTPPRIQFTHNRIGWGFGDYVFGWSLINSNRSGTLPAMSLK